MMQTLTLRERRLVALAILFALLVAAWLLLAAPILGGFASRRDARNAAQADLARDAQLVSSLPRLREEAASAKAALPGLAIVAPTLVAASERAHDRLRATAAASGVTVEAVRQQSATPTALRYELDLRTDMAHLVGLLRALQTDPPIAAMEGLSIAADTAAPGAPPLRVRLDLVLACALTS